jgi:hypothetical protein
VLSDFILSYAISSFFHCLQYDAFAWYYNHSKAKTLSPESQNALFRQIHASNRLWMYVGSIFAYGFLSHILITSAPAAVLLVNRMTGLLHYYYDSFIWRVRKQEFSRHL